MLKHPSFVCPNCDSEYKISFSSSDVDGEPSFCPFCGSDTDFEEMDDITEGDGEDFIIEEIFEED